jgi:hypothetical protein
MNSPNPVPPVTPLPSQWDSAIVRQLLYALLGLAATVLADLFGWSTTDFLAKGGRIIDALLGFAVIAVPLILAWRARRNQATPPIAGTPAVEKVIEREEKIASAPTLEARAHAMKCAPVTVLIAALVACAALAGCQTSPADPINAAETIPQKGFAAVGLYEILQSRGLDVMRMQEAPDNVKTAIADADQKATPVILQLTQALRLYTSIQSITTGPPGGRLAEALRQIEDLTKQAEPLIRALQNALGRMPAQTTGQIEQRGFPALALAWSDAR